MRNRRFALVSMGFALLTGCASAAPSDRAEPEAVGSESAALTGSGEAQYVSHLESDIAAMAAVVGVTGSFQPKSQGIPQRMAAIDATVGALQSEVSAFAAASASGGATVAQLQYWRAVVGELAVLIEQTLNDANAKRAAISAKGEAISIYGMFSMQTLMNHLSQMGEMSSAVVVALNQAIADMARGTKGA